MIKEFVVKITDEVVPNGIARFEEEYAPEQELVRCKDCKHGEPGACGYGVDCDGIWHDDNWFCADAEMRDGDV